MYRIGTVNIDTSHAPAFAEILLRGSVARYTAIYNDGFRTDEEVNAFMKNFGLEARYDSLEEMAGHVDIAFIQSCDWDRHIELAMPFLRAGVPVFIDKPIAGNLRDCLELERRAKALPKFQSKYESGVLKIYAEHAVSPMKGGYMA